MNYIGFIFFVLFLVVAGCSSPPSLDGKYKWDEKRSVANWTVSELGEHEIQKLIESSRGKIITVNGSTVIYQVNGKTVEEEIAIVKSDGNKFTVETILKHHGLQEIVGDLTIISHFELTDNGMIISTTEDVGPYKDYWIRIE